MLSFSSFDVLVLYFLKLDVKSLLPSLFLINELQSTKSPEFCLAAELVAEKEADFLSGVFWESDISLEMPLTLTLGEILSFDGNSSSSPDSLQTLSITFCGSAFLNLMGELLAVV